MRSQRVPSALIAAFMITALCIPAIGQRRNRQVKQKPEIATRVVDLTISGMT